ncbi:MAG: TonB-dependent receptor [Bacteroidales bacterium]|nr:TonB-dependent receptor [Bacteroidales bacterium]
MKKLLVLMLLSVWIIPKISVASAQERVTLEGVITLFESQEPIPFAHVTIKELNLWGFSNDKGLFKISGIIPGNYTLEATSLGYQKYTLPVALQRNITGFRIQLKQENLTLSDVVVTATAGSSLNSSSRVDKRAIEHLQATSLSDVMQLMPGSLIKNPTLTSENRITIRSINEAETNARGVGVMINGAKVSNDAGINSDLIDFRAFSTDNIESVEVLKGVLSAEYGDVTSGAILVTTKVGRSPYEIRVKSDPRTKAFSLAKGLSLGAKAGNLNIDVDYARSFVDWRSPVAIFDRTTMGVTYSNTFELDGKPLRFNARISGYMVGNSVTSDPDVSKLDFEKRRDNNFTVALYGNWQLNKPWITALNYNISGSYGKQNYQKFTVSNQLPLPTTNTKIEGVFAGYFTDLVDQRDQRREEIPMYLNAKLSGTLNKKSGGTLLKTMVGVEFNTRGNNGKGEYYIGASPQYFRERSYTDIPFMSDLSAFVEEKVTIPVGSNKSSLELMAGVRLNKMIVHGFDYDPTLDPRLNAKYNIVKEKRSGFLREFSLRGGWGIMQKLPSMGFLYPDYRYIDNAVFQYRNTATGQSLAVINTMVIDNKLPYNLKPIRTRNAEFGVDFNLSGIRAKFTYFNEKVTDGITANTNYVSKDVEFFNTVSDPNAAPKFEYGKVYIKDGSGNYIPLGSTINKEFRSYSRPDNRGKIDKWGIEYDFDFGRIERINTSVIVNGAYIKSEDGSPGLVYSYSGQTDPINPQIKLPYVGIYQDASVLSLGTGRERLSTNLSFVTRIPSIRMVVSLTTQCIWIENNWNIYDEGNIYIEDATGKPIYGNYNNQSNLAVLYRDPVAYMDHNGTIRPFSDYHTTTDADLKRRLEMLRKSTDNSYYYLTNGYKPYFMANIRVTKELGDLATLSFYANNFTNSTPRMTNKARPNANPVVRNTPIYFGAELKITL